jgi:hypothetical protein
MPKIGCITPSQFKKVMTTSRGGSGFGQTALTYADEIVLDIIGVERDQIIAPALNHGIENESLAVDRYQEDTLNTVTIVDEPIQHPDFDFICGTPDGLIGSDGIVEIKSPFNSVNHLANLRWQFNPDDTQVSDYWWQIQGYLWITNRQWCDFVSYDPRFPYDKQISIQRIKRDQSEIDKLSEKCLLFWNLVQLRLPK